VPVKRPVIISPGTRAEVHEIYATYKKIRESLAARFKQNFEETLTFVAEHPRARPRIFERSRRILMKNFPYHIYYSIKADRILIWSIYHESRDLTLLREREKKI